MHARPVGCGGEEKNIYLLLLLTSIDLPRRFQTITLDRESGLETRRVRGCVLHSHVGVVGLTMRWLVDFGRWMHLTSVPLLCGADLSEGALEWLELESRCVDTEVPDLGRVLLPYNGLVPCMIKCLFGVVCIWCSLYGSVSSRVEFSTVYACLIHGQPPSCNTLRESKQRLLVPFS